MTQVIPLGRSFEGATPFCIMGYNADLIIIMVSVIGLRLLERSIECTECIASIPACLIRRGGVLDDEQEYYLF